MPQLGEVAVLPRFSGSWMNRTDFLLDDVQNIGQFLTEVYMVLRSICSFCTVAGLLIPTPGRAAQCVTSTVTEEFDAPYSNRIDNLTSADWSNGLLKLSSQEVLVNRDVTEFEPEDSMKPVAMAVGNWDGQGGEDLLSIQSNHLGYRQNGGPLYHQSNGRWFPKGYQPVDSLAAYPSGLAWYRTRPQLLVGQFDDQPGEDAISIITTRPILNDPRVAEYVLFHSYSHWNGVIPVFDSPVEISNQFEIAGQSTKFWRKLAVFAIDWNGDSYDDVLMGRMHDSNTAQVVLFESHGDGSFGPAHVLLQSSGFPGPFYFSGPVVGSHAYDIDAVAAGDFDLDGDLDIIVGSGEYGYVNFWRNDGSDSFAETQIPLPTGGTTTILVEDFNKDGNPDFAVMYGRYTIPGISTDDGEDTVLSIHAGDGAGNFNVIPGGVATNNEKAFNAVAININEDGFLDFLLVDHTDGEDYEYSVEVVNESTSTGGYNVAGDAHSADIASVTASNQSISKVTVQITHREALNPLASYRFFVSNNQGTTWEEVALTSNGLVDEATHTFQSLGSRLRWRAELSATPEISGPVPQNYSAESPKIESIRFTYVAAPQAEYSRSGIALAQIVEAGVTKHRVFSPSFEFPGFEAHLRAYDVSTVTGQPGLDPSQAEPISDSNVVWDAGNELQNRTAAGRRIFASTDWPDDTLTHRISFLPIEASSLQTPMGLTLADTTSLIDWIRSGMGHSSAWKFFDPAHSTPVFVGTPTGSSTTPSLRISATDTTSYDQYKSSKASRAQRIYLGANDGMLRAFDPLTGREEWGYIPYNLTSKIKKQRTNNDNYRHQFMIDGTLRSFDVYDFTSAQWRTVLVATQAAGKGLGDANYLFAIDVTEPDNPIPMWEFTDSFSGVANDTATGETWSKPTAGQVLVGGQRRFAIFLASGYNNLKANFPDAQVGRSLHAIDAVTGAWLMQWDLDDLAASASNPSTIDNTVPGGISATDIDADGLIDRVYFGDLEGRFWKIDLGGEIATATACVLFDAGDPNGVGTRSWAPIITTPAIAVLDGFPHVYFGTGGDERAPNDQLYRFYAIRDDLACNVSMSTTPLITQSSLSALEYEWVVGDGKKSDFSTDLDHPDDEGQIGDRYWSDPVIDGGGVIYFASLSGSIESELPCEDTGGSRLFAYAIRPLNIDGVKVRSGQSIFGTQANIAISTKVRQSAATLGAQPPVVVGETPLTGGLTQAFFQTFSSASNLTNAPTVVATGAFEVSAPTASSGSPRLLRWREIPLSR